MAKGVTVTVHGDKELIARLKKLPKQTREGTLAAVREAAESVKLDQQMDVPIDTGRLFDSIGIEYDDAALTASVGPRGGDVYYSQFIEYGTSSIAAQPFIYPSGVAERPKFPKRVRQHVRRKIGA